MKSRITHSRRTSIADVPKAFSPILWYRAEGYNFTTGGWADKSGNGNNATARVSAATAGTAINSRQTVHLTATSGNNVVVSPSITVGPFTCIVVGKFTGTAGYPMVQINDGSVSGAYLYGSTGNTINISRNSVVCQKNLSANWFADNVAKAVALRFDGTAAGTVLDIGGVSQSLTNVNNSSPGTVTKTGAWGFGGRPADGGGPVAGDFGEIILIPRSITASELASLFAYTLAYWGV